MDIISNKPAFKRKVLILWSAILFILHAVYTLLSIYQRQVSNHKYISDNPAYGEMDTFLSLLLPVLALIIVYIRYGVPASVYHSYEKGTLPFTLVAIASLIFTRIGDHFIYIYEYTLPKDLWVYVFNVILAFLVDLSTLLFILLFSKSLRRLMTKNPKLKRINLTVWGALYLILEAVFIFLSTYKKFLPLWTENRIYTPMLYTITVLRVCVCMCVFVSIHQLLRKAAPLFIAACSSILIAEKAVCLIILKSNQNIQNANFYASFMVDLVLIPVIIILSKKPREIKPNAIHLMLLFCAFPVIISFFNETWYLINIIMEIKAEYGSARLNAGEIITAIWSYIRIMIAPAIGFVIMRLTYKRLKSFTKK